MLWSRSCGHRRRGTDAVPGRVLAGVLLAGEPVQPGEHHVRHVTGNFPVQGVRDDAARDRAQVGQRGDSRLRRDGVEPEPGCVTVDELVEDLLGARTGCPGGICRVEVRVRSVPQRWWRRQPGRRFSCGRGTGASQ